jgi:CHAT domain-containing protein
MAERIRVRGSSTELSDQERGRNEDLGFQDGIAIEVKHVIDVTAQGRALGEELTIELDDDDIIESRDADGWVSLTTVKELRARTSGDRSARVDGAIDLIPALASGDVSRGGTDLSGVTAYAAKLPAHILEELNILDRLAGKGVDMASEVAARAAAKKVVEWLERSVPDEAVGEDVYGKPKEPGVYRLGAGLEILPQRRLAAGRTMDEGHHLVLVHGTFSSTEGGFSALRGKDEWQELIENYQGVYALEHKTLSVNPVVNALQLARSLPRQAKLDLVSHSRGGLVGEFLSLAAAGRLDPELHKRRDHTIRAEEQALLRELVDTLASKQIEINRFVRVASPSSGTILASERIDEVAGFLFNVVEKIPGVAGWIFTVLKSLALAFLNQRARPDVIPGLEAMMPSSPFIGLLNVSGSTDPQLGFDDGLGVIAGDVDRSRWFKWFREKGADLFYGEEHDYVVDTLSMYQGAQRSKASVSLHAGPKVNHFTYFSEADSRKRLRDWLTSPETSGFKALDRRPAELPKATAKHRGAEDAPIVIVVPDVFGSSLQTADGAVAWPDPSYVVRNGLVGIGKSAAGLKAGELLNMTYGPLVERLSGEFRVESFPYDWRTSLADAGAALAAFVDEFDDPRPLRVIAHGAGGLVVKSALARMANAKDRICHVVLLGSPLAGTLRALQWATGNGDSAELLHLLDRDKSTRAVGKALRAYESVQDLLPPDEEVRSSRLWEELDSTWSGVEDTQARAAELYEAEWPVTPVTVAGYRFPTPARFERHGSVLRYFGTEAGDGIVTVASSGHGESPDYFVEAAHGDLPSHEESYPGYADLLRNGTTQRLDGGPLDVEFEEREMPVEPGRHLFPAAVDLERAALGGGLRRVQPPQPGLEIEVAHGNLCFANYAVMVGHYKGSTLLGAEWALDRYLNGRLTNRDVLGLYPGDVGKAEVVFAEQGRMPPAAIVVGMGEIGTITRAKVTATVAEGAARAAIAQVERKEAASGGQSNEATSVGISTVLIGNNGPYGLSVDNAIGAITAGIVDANRLLSHAPDRKIRIDRLQFIELYEDVAIEMLHAVHRMVGSPGDSTRAATLFGSARISASRHLRVLEGGKSGQPPPEYNRGEWRPIMVESVTRCEEDPCAECEAKLADFEVRDVEPGAGSRPPETRAAPAGGAPPPAAAPAAAASSAAAPAAEQRKPSRRKVPRHDLTFTSIGMAARAERMVHAWQRQLVERIVDKVVGEPRPDEQVYNTLYELLVPNYLKGVTSDADNILLVLDSDATRYPWEMLATRTATGEILPIAARSGVVRRLVARGTFSDPKRAVGTNALVIGDPPAGSGFHRLPGAQKEAKRMVEVLTANGFQVTSQIPEGNEDRSLEIVNSLFSDEYRIIHIAAHGVYDEDPEKSGVVIGPDAFLSPLTFQQMGSVPPLVFLNCCHIGTIGKQYREFAASVSEQLIRDGVRAVVAAGWAVNDTAAARFAEVFYGQMFRGQPFGEAVKVARQTIYQEHGSANNTWGAYQCYGDPGFKLVSRSAGDEDRGLVTPKELRDRLRGVAERSRDEPHEDLINEADALLRSVPRSWLTSKTNDAAGRAFGELGAFQEAIHHYEQALADNDAEVPVKSIEQLANLQGRYAEQLHARGGVTKREIAGLLRDATEWHRRLLRIGSTPERHRNLAAHYRRSAAIYTDTRRATAIKNAADEYNEARKLHTEADPDSTINWAVFTALVGLLPKERALIPEQSKEIHDAVADSLDEAQRRVNTDPDFWSRVALPDAAFALALLDGALHDQTTAIAGAYGEVLGFASPREKASVTKHLEFVQTMLEWLGHPKVAADVGTILVAVQAAV